MQNIQEGGALTTCIYQMMQSDDPVRRFPAPIKIGRNSRWPESAVRTWMERQMASSVNSPAA